MALFQDSTLQIFLTIYHGSLLGTFFYDYIIKNALKVFLDAPKWIYISNVCLGVFFIMIIIWAILSVWSRVKRNLLISVIVLIVIFIARLSIGIPELVDRQRWTLGNQRTEDLVIFITQMVVHTFGIIATYLLSQNS